LVDAGNFELLAQAQPHDYYGGRMSGSAWEVEIPYDAEWYIVGAGDGQLRIEDVPSGLPANLAQVSSTGEALPAGYGRSGELTAARYEQMSGDLPQDVPNQPVAPPPDPVINPAGPPVLVDNPYHDDLDDTIADSSWNLGGDGVKPDHRPFLNGNLNPLPGPPDTRPIPTGTAEGLDGVPYGFFSQPRYHNPDRSPNGPYVTMPSQVVNLNDPKHVIGTVPVAQASGVYDPASKRMYVVGNDANGVRQLWKSQVVDPAHPHVWAAPGAHWDFVGNVMEGNRENQLVRLRGGGGYLLVGARVDFAVEGVAASTPEGLINRTANDFRVLVDNNAVPGVPGVPGVYGPTIVSDRWDPNSRTDTITLRVSQYAPPSSPEGTYDPQLYATTFTVTQP